MPDTLPDKLRAYRVRHTLTQKALAARFGLSQRTIEGWEAGRITSHAVAISVLLSEILGD